MLNQRTFIGLSRPARSVEIQPETHYKRLMTAAPANIVNVTPYRVIYGDTDQMGVVYYANYLRWFEKGRSEFLRQIGLPYPAVERQGFNFPVVEVSCRYLQSARYDDEVHIETVLTELGRASLSFQYRISRDADDCLLATGSTKHACLDRNGRLTRMPKTLQEAIDNAAR
jgi:acyl-CoA thioester hydrolase